MLGQEFILEIIYPRINELITSLENLLNKNMNTLKAKNENKQIGREIENKNESKNRLNDLKTEISFSRTLNINNFNYEEALMQCTNTNKTKNSEYLDLNKEKNQTAQDTQENNTVNINYNNNNTMIKKAYLEIINSFNTENETIIFASFLYHSLKVSN